MWIISHVNLCSWHCLCQSLLMSLLRSILLTSVIAHDNHFSCPSYLRQSFLMSTIYSSCQSFLVSNISHINHCSCHCSCQSLIMSIIAHVNHFPQSHMLLSKHIEKAELTISEAQKGLESLCSTTTSYHTSSSRESLTEGVCHCTAFSWCLYMLIGVNSC